MNSSNNFSSGHRAQNSSKMVDENEFTDRNQTLDITLSYEQYLILQHHLPKKYALLQLKEHGSKTKRHTASSNLVNLNSSLKVGTTGSSHFQNQEEKRNVSKVSAGNNTLQNNSEIEGKSKRSRIKKVDRYLDEEPLSVFKEQPKRSATIDKVHLDDEMTQCMNILNSLKKHRCSGPFLQPVDPKRDGVADYFKVIKDPMDLVTIEKNLKNNVYETQGQFHGDVKKIFINSYEYNEKNTPVYKMAVEMEKYYKNILTNDTVYGAGRTTKSLSKGDKSKTKQRKRDRQTKGDDKKKKKQSKGQKNEPSNANSSKLPKSQVPAPEVQASEAEPMQVQQDDDRQANSHAGKKSMEEQDIDYDGYD